MAAAKAKPSFSFIDDIEALNDLKWQKRVVLIFNEAQEPEQAIKLHEAFATLDPEQINSRHLTVLRVPDKQQADPIRDKFNIESQTLTTLLIGKDGYVKARRLGVFDPGEFFPIIDSMPMRQQEMRDQQKGLTNPHDARPQ